MSVVVVGLNHHTAPLSLLERVRVPSIDAPSALRAVADRPHLVEAVLLSTCNRTEVYACCTEFRPGVQDIAEFLAVRAGVARDDLAPALYTYQDDAAVAHLFAVAAGIDSMILGEGEVLGQVRSGWLLAEREGTVGHALRRAFRHAVEVGKRVRTETAIGRGPASMPAIAVAVAEEHRGSLDTATVMVVGAGVMGEAIASALRDAGTGDIVLANRSVDRAVHAAGRIGGRAVGLDEVPDVLVDADVLVTATGSSETVVTADDVAHAMHGRTHRPLLVIDIAVPRDVESAAGGIPGVTLVDLASLGDHAAHVLAERRAQLSCVRAIIRAELGRHGDSCTASSAAPLVVALRDWGEEARLSELQRYRTRLADLDERQREAVEALTRGLVNKLLHGPTARLRTVAADTHEVYRDLLASFLRRGESDTADIVSGRRRTVNQSRVAPDLSRSLASDENAVLG